MLNLVDLLLDASYMERDEGKRGLAWAYGSKNGWEVGMAQWGLI